MIAGLVNEKESFEGRPWETKPRGVLIEIEMMRRYRMLAMNEWLLCGVSFLRILKLFSHRCRTRKLILLTMIIFFSFLAPAYAVDVTLQWNPSTDSSVVGYKVYYRAGSSGAPYNGTEAAEGRSPVDVQDVTQFTLHGLSDTETYYFAVTAYKNSAPRLESAYSNEASLGAGAGNTPPPQGRDNDPPSIAGYPSLDVAKGTIDITFDESEMLGATVEGNYAFSPTLLFKTVGGSDDINYVGGNTYRLSMAFIPRNTLFTLSVINITDAAGNKLTPDSKIRINDNDNDRMADDWELAGGLNPNDPRDVNDDPDKDGLTNFEEFNGGGSLATSPRDSDTDKDLMDDGWEVKNGLNPLVDDALADLDGDGLSNYEEYKNGSDPSVAGSVEIKIAEVSPAPDTGSKVPVDSTFSFRIEATNGIDVGNPDSVVFNIEEKGIPAYSRNLGEQGIRVKKLTSDPDSAVTELWVEYDRFEDPATGQTWQFNDNVAVSLTVKDTWNGSITSKKYRFMTQTDTEHLDALANRPKARTEEKPGNGRVLYLSVTLDDDTGLAWTLLGAEITFNPDDAGVTPYFGPVEGNAKLPPLNLPGTMGVGAPLNVQPHRTFSSGITVFIPVTGYGGDLDDLNVYGYNGDKWQLLVDHKGRLHTAGRGWVKRGWNRGLSRALVKTGGQFGITIWADHFSGFAVGTGPAPNGAVVSAGNAASGNLSAADGGAAGGGSCFISTLLQD